MQQNSFSLGCNYSNRDITDARASWNLCPIQDIDTVFTSRYNNLTNVDDTFSLLYCDLYLRQLKETLKNTMLLHESVFESQIHELHRLYRRQKELMMEIEGNRRHDSCFSGPRTPWMSSRISTYQTKNFPYEAVDNIEKVLDLELSVSGCHDIEENRSLMNGEVHQVTNFLKEQSLESGNRSNKLELDLNEPAKIEEHSDQLSSVKCQGEYGIDLNLSPISSDEEVTIVKKFESKKPQESLLIPLDGKHGSEESRVLVLALPCSNSSLLLDKPLMRNSRLRKKKVKLGPSKNNFKDSKSNLGLHLNAKAESESQSNQARIEKGRSTKMKSARNQIDLGKKRRCKPPMKSSNDQKVVAKKKRKKSRRICLVTEGDYQEISAAEAIVDMSRKSSQETSDSITSLSRNLLWFAEISSSVVEDYELALPKLEEHNRTLIKNSADNKTVASSIVLGKQRRSKARQGKRKWKDDHHGYNLSLSRFSECKPGKDLHVTGMLHDEASESKCNRRFLKKKRRSSHLKPIETFTTSVGVEWGAIRKRRRSSRVPATEFQNLIID